MCDWMEQGEMPDSDDLAGKADSQVELDQRLGSTTRIRDSYVDSDQHSDVDSDQRLGPATRDSDERLGCGLGSGSGGTTLSPSLAPRKRTAAHGGVCFTVSGTASTVVQTQRAYMYLYIYIHIYI